jgi:hypothetical protein
MCQKLRRTSDHIGLPADCSIEPQYNRSTAEEARLPDYRPGTPGIPCQLFNQHALQQSGSFHRSALLDHRLADTGVLPYVGISEQKSIILNVLQLKQSLPRRQLCNLGTVNTRLVLDDTTTIELIDTKFQQTLTHVSLVSSRPAVCYHPAYERPSMIHPFRPPFLILNCPQHATFQARS